VEDSDKEETEEAAKEGNGEKAEEGEGESKAKEEEAGTPESGAVAVAGPTNYQKRKLRDQQKKGRAQKVNKGAIDSLADQLAACSSGNILNFVNMITLKLNLFYFPIFLDDEK
jgi:hypothetical protein